MENKRYTLEELILLLRNYVLIIKKNIILISIVSTIFISLFVIFRTETYNAQSSLFLKSSKSSRIFSLASSFGLGADTEVNYDKIKSVAESDYIIKKVLFSSVTINNKKDILINHLIDEKKLRLKWAKNRPDLINIKMEEEGFIQDSICLEFINMIKLSTKVNENKEKLIEIQTTNKKENYAVEINKLLVQLTLEFFKDIEINDELKTKEYIKHRLDSVQNKLLTKENEYAVFSDQTFSLVKSQGLLERKRIERELRILNEMYIELVKQLELINFKVLDKKSSIQLLNSPNYPLKPKKRSLVISVVLGGMLGFFLSISFVLLKIRYKKALQNIKK